VGIVVDELYEFAKTDEAERLRSSIEDQPLPEASIDYVEEYSNLEQSRGLFIWKWIDVLTPWITLPFVPESEMDTIRELKVLSGLLITVMDDMMERQKDRLTFKELSKVPFDEQTVNWDRDGLIEPPIKFCEMVWDRIEGTLKRSRHFDEFMNLLLFDFDRSIQSIEYSALITERPWLATLEELVGVQSNNMIMFPYADLDLMFAEDPPEDELSNLRQAVWEAQKLVRLSNWITTWERELRQGDFSSGVMVRALQEGVVGKEKLQSLKESNDAELTNWIVDKIKKSSVERKLLSRWDSLYLDLQSTASSIDTFDLSHYVQGMKKALKYDLASTGLK
jgi:hypothetical protein